MAEQWLTTLRAGTPQGGWKLAVRLSRMSIKVTQPSNEARGQLRAAYGHDTAQLVVTCQVSATHVQTVAAPNDW